MKQSIINSINLVIAAGGEVELWHPNRGDKGGIIGTVFRVDSRSDFVMTSQNGKEMVWDWHYVKDCKIPRYSFAHLCRSVEADPVDNAATKAGKAHSEASMKAEVNRIMGDPSIILMNSNGQMVLKPDYSITLINWRLSPNFFLSLIASGYPCGIPAEHWIDREKLEESK